MINYSMIMKKFQWTKFPQFSEFQSSKNTTGWLESRAWPPLINSYGPQHWNLALARVLPALSASLQKLKFCCSFATA